MCFAVAAHYRAQIMSMNNNFENTLLIAVQQKEQFYKKVLCVLHNNIDLKFCGVKEFKKSQTHVTKCITDENGIIYGKIFDICEIYEAVTVILRHLVNKVLLTAHENIRGDGNFIIYKSGGKKSKEIITGRT